MLGNTISIMHTVIRHSYKSKMQLLIIFCCSFVFILSPSNSRALTGADVAVYNDTGYQGGGTWMDGLLAIESMLSYYGYTYEQITPDELNATPNLNSLYKMIIVGGGWAGGYNYLINYNGFENIRNFVSNGGGYFGICAGAYLASSIVMWTVDFQSPVNAYYYPLNLFSGISAGVIPHIKGWYSLTNCSTSITEGAAMTTININTTALPDINPTLNVLYYGGPFFIPLYGSGQNVTVLGTYPSVGAPSDGYGAMVMFNYGSGKVFLTGPHLEVSFSNCSLWYDPNTWKFMKTVIAKLIGK
ncbi:MAG: hypothetical protein HQL08_00325 [Nitrospirae bacterium]|nr:hypothetical protein [Nitrospirota bacterium]